MNPLVLLVVVVIVGLQALFLPTLARALQHRGGSIYVATACLAAMVIGGGIWVGVFMLCGFGLESDPVLFWLGVCPLAALIGGGASFVVGRVVVWDYLLACCWLALILIVVVVTSGEGLSLADPLTRTLIVLPAALTLFGYFGSSLVFLLKGDKGETELASGFELWLGQRFLLSKSSPVLSVVTTLALLGVTLGVWLVIVSLAVLAGFEHDLTRKIIGTHAHVVVAQEGSKPFVAPDDLLQIIESHAGVLKASPFIEGAAAAASSSNHGAGVLYGIDPQRVPDVLDTLKKSMREGSLSDLSLPPPSGDNTLDELGFVKPSPLPKLVLGSEIQKSLNVRLGDAVRLINPALERLTPVGPVPASQGYRVAGVFSSEMYEFDAQYIYASIDSARRFFALADDAITGVQVRVKNPDRAETVGVSLKERLLNHYCPKDNVAANTGLCRWSVQDWKSRNETLFAALKLERVVAFVVLAFVILVASFAIVNTLSMSVIEKQEEIAILKTMGTRDVGIMKMFLFQGILVGGFGILFGTLGALTTVTMLQHIGFSIPDAVYYIDSLPVHLEPWDVVLVVGAAFLIMWNFSVFPALRGAKLKPVEGLRDG
jgi:lipoprotein-releasing system permease protein